MNSRRRRPALGLMPLALTLFCSVTATGWSAQNQSSSVAAWSRQAGTVTPGREAEGVLETLRQHLDRVARARARDERFDIRDLDPTMVDVAPLVGATRQALRDRLGTPTVDCRRTLPGSPPGSSGRIAPCRAEDDLAYSFYTLPKGWRGGGSELLLEFDGGERCTRARWFRTQ